MLLTDTHHVSNGGDWNNINAGNWAIWYDLGSDPTEANPRPFLNEPNPLSNNIEIPNGTSTYILYKNNNNTAQTDFTDFDFKWGPLTGTILIDEALVPYLTTPDPVPAVAGASVTMGPATVTITHFAWYHRDVFGKDFVGQQQSLGADGSLDDIGILTINFVPEPSSLALLGAGAVGLFGIARRRRT